MNNQEITLSLIMIWTFIGFYYIYKVWFEPRVIVLGLGFTFGLILAYIIDKLKKDLIENSKGTGGKDE